MAMDVQLQKQIFKNSEGNAWFSRNQKATAAADFNDDPVLKAMALLKLAPERVLEIGCADGWRLNKIAAAFNSQGSGIDPSEKAIVEGKGRFPQLNLAVGTADSLPFPTGGFDTIIFGFCLYLCDRADLFKIASEADRCLQDKGNLILLDFSPPFPFKNSYSHYQGIYSYKMQYASMFTWNPAYQEVFNLVTGHGDRIFTDDPNDKMGVNILRKSSSNAYPDSPF